MGFQIKDFVSIAASMVNYSKATQDQLTDYNVGSVARTMFESPAIEIEELYQRIFAGLMDAIPVAVYRAFGFDTLDATAASGTVAVSFGVPIEVPFVIPAGTVFKAPSTALSYTSIADVHVEAGETSAYVSVVSTVSGSGGNAQAGAITEAVNFDLPIGSTITSAAIVSGRDGESDDERQSRFNDFIQSLSRGTLPSVIYAASQALVKSAAGVTTEFVAKVGYEEQAGHVDVYLYGSNGLPSDELVAASQKIIDGYYEADGTAVAGYAPAGNRVTVRKMNERAVDVDLQVSTFAVSQQTDSTKLAIRVLLESAFSEVQAGGVMLIGKLTEAALSATGVHSVTSANNENIPCANNEVLTVGTLNVEWVDA